MQQPTKWEEYLHPVEFAYNNSYHDSLKMSPYEVLYGRICTTPTNWSNPKEKLILRQDMLAKMENTIRKVCQSLKVSQDRHKSYADKKRTYREFQVGDHVYVRVKPKRSTLRWGGCVKLAPNYCGPFQVLKRIGLMAYELALPSHMC